MNIIKLADLPLTVYYNALPALHQHATMMILLFENRNPDTKNQLQQKTGNVEKNRNDVHQQRNKPETIQSLPQKCLKCEKPVLFFPLITIVP